MKIVFYENFLNEKYEYASKLLFTTNSGHIPREYERVVYKDDIYKVLTVTTIYEYDQFLQKQNELQIDILLRRI